MIESLRILLIHQPYRLYGGEDRVFEQERDALIQALGKNQVWIYGADTVYSPTWQLPFHLLHSKEHYNKVFQLVQEHRIQVVHVHNFFPWLSPSVFRAAKDAGAAVVHTLHNYRRWCVKGELYLEKKGICEQCIESKSRWPAVQQACYRSSTLQSLAASVAFSQFESKGDWEAVDRFIVLSKFQEKWVLERGIPPEKLVYKPNWIGHHPSVPIERRNGLVWAGRLEPSKGIDLLLNAFQQVSLNIPLTIVGSGSLEAALRKEYALDERIEWKGLQSPEMTRQIIGSARYLLQTSLWYETFGLTILEAMQMGVPVIGFPIGTRTEFIEHGNNGFLTEPGALAETIQLVYDSANYPSLSKNAFTFASTFGQDQILSSQLQLYRSLITNYEST
ncbi:MAG: glycosyltransferase [Hydrotalea sp.]|nr:glycosyltransferase [Hydrotalea sp.]